MATPTTREELKQYALRKLGAPVIEINVDDAQLEDALDDSLQIFAEYHFDGVEKVFYKYCRTRCLFKNVKMRLFVFISVSIVMSQSMVWKVIFHSF